MEQIQKRKKRRKVAPRFYVIVTLFVVLIIGLTVLLGWMISQMPGCSGRTDSGNPLSSAKGTSSAPTPAVDESGNPITPSPSPTPVPTPHMVSASDPSQYGYTAHLEVNGSEISATGYVRTATITFPAAADYYADTVDGVLTFRGNNFRNSASAGTLHLTEKRLETIWDKTIGALQKGSSSGSWSGCGWTGQPLIVHWSEATRNTLNRNDFAKNKDLVEVIYPTEDGKIYFLDLETGVETRAPITMNVPFKGTGSIDPRGYPLLYIGSGDEYESDSQKSRAYIISLIDGSVLYEFGKQGTDSFAKRNWYAYDSAPLIDATTDTLIYPGENGVIYTMKLNTSYDPATGTLRVNPDNVVKFRYDSYNSYTEIDVADSSHKWLGYEGSASAWNGFLYLSSNDGLFQCINLNTMQIVWVADTQDDTNGSPVLDVISETEAYLYVGTSLHFNKDGNGKGIAPFFKINAMTGEIVKQYGLTVHTVSGVSGGIQSTAAVGRAGSNISDLVFISIARYPDRDTGVLVALDKETFEVRWKMDMACYSWSSPAVVYTSNNEGYVLQADSGGNIFLLDGATGAVLDTVAPTDSNFEASPAVYGNILVLGCRGDQQIFGIRLS